MAVGCAQPYLCYLGLYAEKDEKNKNTPGISDEFTPMQVVGWLRQSWYGLFLFMVVGGLVGYGLHWLIPPKYSSSSALTFSIDYNRTGELTDVETDIAIVTIGDIISSTQVIKSTLAAGAELGLPAESFKLYKTAYFDRYSYRYELVVLNPDNEIAAQWANIWVEESARVLVEARMHALTAEILYKQLVSMQDCIEKAAVIEPISANCEYLSIPEMQTLLKTYNTSYLTEKELSLAYLPAIDFAITEYAEPSASPGRQQAGLLEFGGAMLGLLAYFGFILIRKSSIKGF